jgi:hypothetical protein
MTDTPRQVLPRNVRLERLRALRNDPDKRVGSQKLFYKDSSSQLPIHQVDLDWLIYNEHNGRLESEMLTWKREHSVGDGVDDSELNSLIETFLWNVNVSKNKQTMEDLQHKGQQRPAIVTLDGVIIDGNRRAMLLRRLNQQWIEAIILPDAYAENEKEIVKLETQYQIGEDSKLDYGAVEKYLHVKRLKGLDISDTDIADLMSETKEEIKRLFRIMELMDEYLEHTDSAGLYKMLRTSDGTKEGMFVDLYQDLKRFQGGTTKLGWVPEDIDFDDLKTVQFDYIRFGGDFSDTGKRYRDISHNGSGEKSFFAHDDIWKHFSEEHHQKVDPITEAIPSLDQYMSDHPELASRVDAALARDREWRRMVGPEMKRIFGQRQDDLQGKVETIEPKRLLSMAASALAKIPLDNTTFLSDPANIDLINQINNITYEMRKLSKQR